MIEIKHCKLIESEVRLLLEKSDAEFDPPQSSWVDLDEYATKLSNNAHFIIAVDDHNIVSYLAYYVNEVSKFAYIPLFWVASNERNKGIGKSMLDELTMRMEGKVNSIQLQVLEKNIKAQNFYTREGFRINERREERLYLSKHI